MSSSPNFYSFSLKEHIDAPKAPKQKEKIITGIGSNVRPSLSKLTQNQLSSLLQALEQF